MTLAVLFYRRLVFSASFAHTPPKKMSCDLSAYARHELESNGSNRDPVRNDDKKTCQDVSGPVSDGK